MQQQTASAAKQPELVGSRFWDTHIAFQVCLLIVYRYHVSPSASLFIEEMCYLVQSAVEKV